MRQELCIGRERGRERQRKEERGGSEKGTCQATLFPLLPVYGYAVCLVTMVSVWQQWRWWWWWSGHQQCPAPDQWPSKGAAADFPGAGKWCRQVVQARQFESLGGRRVQEKGDHGGDVCYEFATPPVPLTPASFPLHTHLLQEHPRYFACFFVKY